MFNLLHVVSGDKVDFWMLTDDPFDRERFARRQEVQALGIQLTVSTPEDTLLQKLRWAHLSGGSEKQFTDALRVFEVQRGSMDVAYIERWARELGIEELWRRVQAEAEAI
jgi:hypothetical protein